MKPLANVFFAIIVAFILCLVPSPVSKAQAQNINVNRGDILITEFRLRGTNGPADEFIEIYNNTDQDVLVLDLNTDVVRCALMQCGWALVDNSDRFNPRFVVPNGTMLKARGHYLAANTGVANSYSLSAYASPDTTYSSDIPDYTGLALFKTTKTSAATGEYDDTNSILDVVGFAGIAAPYREGAGLPSMSGIEEDGEDSFVRKIPVTLTGVPQDTNDNANDFVLVSTSGGTFGGLTSVLGAPAPENLSSPIVRNTIRPSFVEPTSCAACEPNRVRNGAGNSGDLKIRRKFTNNTGATITRLRFRIVDITTLHTPALTLQQADLRLVTSADEDITLNNHNTLKVKGTILENPSSQINGGGLNSSVTVQLPQAGLASGESLDVQFVLGVMLAGRFRVQINIEALP
jgi:hypothetical protein